MKQEDDVIIRWGSIDEKKNPRILSMFHESDWSGLLKGSKEMGKHDEVTLTMMYKNVWEGKV